MLAVSEDGKPRAQDSDLVPPQKLACGNTHTLYLEQALSLDGGITGATVVGWGGNRNRQLGLSPQGGEGDRVAGPTDAVFCGQEPPTADGAPCSQDILEVACGSNHSLVLERLRGGEGGALRASRLWAFGLNASGQLGRRGEGAEGAGDALMPGEVAFPIILSNKVVVQRVACGTDHTLVIANFVGQGGGVVTVAGRVFAWGISGHGALGTRPRTDPTVPNEVWFPSDLYDEDDPGRSERVVVIQQVAAGTKHSVALGANGSVYTWGHGGNGRLGLGNSVVRGSSSYTASFEPRCVDTFGDTKIKYIGVGVAIKQIAFGLMHSMATSMKGQLYAWGKGPATGLDANNNAIVPVPRLVEMPERDPVQQIAAGPLHTVVLMCDGTLYCFGSASEGRLPFKAPLGSVPRDQTFPKKMDTKGWSLEHERALGSGQGSARGARASRAGGEERAKDHEWWPRQLCSGGSHSAVLCEGGQSNLWFWGAGTLSGAVEPPPGQAEERDYVAQPALLKRGFPCQVRMLAIGLEHCLAVTADGQMYSWGNGEKGQLGSGNIRGVVQPQPVVHPTDVMCVSAGEEHSACIIEGGEAYLWGNAEGGRLGLGNCLSEGVQLLPKQVVISDADGAEGRQAVLLRSVACGSQHTAFISEDDRLLTFGMGWFGRLGHGGLENQYSPRFVRAAGFRVRSVHCALFHTCLVDEERALWACGRDSSVCRDGLGHLTEPAPFEPFAQEPRRYIHALATSEEHSLAITFQKGSQAPPELWVWGKNSRGQLGLPADVAPRVHTPWQLPLPDLVHGRKQSTRYDLRAVSTAPGHSLLLAVLSKYSAKLGRHVEEPVVYAWGYSGNGRLGHSKDSEERLQRQHEQCVENSLPSGSTTAPVFPPLRVEPRWKPEETVRSRHGRGDAAEDPQADLAQPSQSWHDVQLKLYREPLDQKPRSLEEMAHEVSGLYSSYMSEVCGLWDRAPAGADVSEYTLRQRQREIEAEYVRSLTVLKLGVSMCAPKLPGRVKTEREVLQRLPHFEGLCWTLQQQPLYMANLAACLWGRRAEDPDAALFHRVAQSLYADLRDTRTLHLFKALLRVMIEQEMGKATSIEEVFDPTKSRVAPLFTQLCTSIHTIERLAMPIVDPERESSLVSLIIRYTVSRDGKTPRNYKEAKSNQPDFSGVFVVKWQEYEELLAAYRPTGAGEKARPESRKSRQHFATELRCFKELCVRDEAAEAEDAELASRGQIADFVAAFIRDVLKRDEDLRMLLVCAFSSLLPRQYVFNQKANDADAWKPGVCAPLTSLVLGAMLGGVLHALGNEGQFSLVRLKIRQQVRRREAELIDSWNRRETRKDEGAEVEADTEGLIHRVFFNIQALANFLRRVVAPRGYAEFAKDGEKEEPLARDCAQALHSLANETLLGMLQERAGAKGLQRAREYGEDLTETQLVVDLYTAHYSLRRTQVSLSTEDLLLLANLLWRHTKGGSEEASALCLDDAARDRLCQLVRAALPVQKQKGESEAQPAPWSAEGQLWHAHDHGECHNLMLHSRFLEFERSGDAEPTFCDVSQAPIPKYLAREVQKYSRAISAVKPLRTPEEDKGHGLDRAFEFLEELLQDLSGTSKQHSSVRYRIDGTSFMELQSEFQEFQQQISQDVEEGRVPPTMSALLQRLEDGKRMMDKIREQQQDERSLRSWIDKQVRRRSEHHQYLMRVKTGADEITKAKERYREDLRRQCNYLFHLHHSTVYCDIPEDILVMAQQHSERLAFEKARVKKAKLRRSHPTPAQRVLESLKNETKDGKITDELRDKVGVPARSFKLRELVEKGVIVRVHEKVPAPVQQQMDFTFQFKDEGWVVQAYMKTTLFKEFTISRRDIQLLQTGRKPTVWPYGDEFLWINCFRLVRLLAWIYAEGAL